MASRSLRHREQRRRRVPVRVVPTRDPSLKVSIRLRDAKGIRQSFLILPGHQQAVVLNGYVDGHGGFRRIELPVIVSATIV